MALACDQATVPAELPCTVASRGKCLPRGWCLASGRLWPGRGESDARYWTGEIHLSYRCRPNLLTLRWYVVPGASRQGGHVTGARGLRMELHAW